VELGPHLQIELPALGAGVRQPAPIGGGEVRREDGSQVLSGSNDRTLRLWDVATGTEIRTFKGHSDDVRSVAFAPDGSQVLSGSDDKTLKLWDVATGMEIQTFTGHSDNVTSVAYSPVLLMALSGSDDKTLKLWDLSGQ
jgi:WD40 repeat protein